MQNKYQLLHNVPAGDANGIQPLLLPRMTFNEGEQDSSEPEDVVDENGIKVLTMPKMDFGLPRQERGWHLERPPGTPPKTVHNEPGKVDANGIQILELPRMKFGE